MIGSVSFCTGREAWERLRQTLYYMKFYYMRCMLCVGGLVSHALPGSLVESVIC